MLHVPNNLLLETSDIWCDIVSNRKKFYTRNLKAFVGYCRKQASKYGIKGSRLNDAKRVLDYCDHFILKNNYKLKDVWDNLPTGEFIQKLPEDINGIRMYEVCSRKIGETATIAYLIDVVQKFYDNYGERARQAANNEGIDWKAISHAFRAAYQTKEILTEETITFPLREAEFLKQVKSGQLHFSNDLANKLDDLMDEIEILSSKSNLPEKVDRKFWDSFLIQTIEKNI